MRDIIRQKLAAALEFELPPLTPRHARLPGIQGKAHAVIGMRRAGKTYFLYQCLQERLAQGTPRERLVYFSFEDERLGAMRTEDLGLILEEYYRVFPTTRGNDLVTLCLDEIQTVPMWERFVRRIMDEERVEILLSGSSARMLSREVATSMRGRAMETVITPFSFSEYLEHHGIAVPDVSAPVGPRARSRLEAGLDAYLSVGGFPEAQNAASAQDRVALLQGYVDAVLFRDVVERHSVTNVEALRAMIRQLMRNPARTVSVSKLHRDLRSQGIAVSKESLLGYMSFLEDAFLIQPVSLFARSERRRQVNPRKVYLADHSLAVAYSAAGAIGRGHLLENMVACALFRTASRVHYYVTTGGLEVDFLVGAEEANETFVQVSADISDAATRERELRALTAASGERPGARLLLLAEVPEESVVELEGQAKATIIPVSRFLCDPSVSLP
jgi:predicted AAA+ superfamily ATPase